MEPQYDPKKVEGRIYESWEQGGFFNPDKLPSAKKPYSITIPPPNVTGNLHMGHALNATIQDVLIRWKRMQGFKTLWVPGTDHAGIATQNVVEKKLKKEGKSRFDLGREKFIEKNGLPIYDGSQEFCLWLGCMGSYDPQGREIVLAFAEVLRGLGIGFGVLKREKCTGDPARRLGNDYLFGELAQANLELLRECGVKKLVSICPHCVRTIGTDWREFGAEVPIEHHSELLARHAAGLPQRAAARDRVVYHDACYLGRYRGVYDQPRAVVQRWGALVEPERARERGFCCGAGGGLAFLGEEQGKRVNRERAEQLLATGAPVVAAACPFCNTMLRDGLASASSAPPQLLDIAQIAAASLKLKA